jgi:thymidylate kinase
MGTNRDFIRALFTQLNEKYNYAILRSYHELPDNFTSHDIDILIDKKEFTKLKYDIHRLIKNYGYKVLMVNENDRFVTFIIAQRVENQLEFLYLDFFFNYSLYGVCLINGDEVLKRKKYNGKVYHVDIIDEFLEKFLNTSLLNQPYPKKYNHILHDVKENHTDKLKIQITTIFSDKTIDEEKCVTFSGKKLLFKALLSNLLKRPFKQLTDSLNFLYFYFKGWLKPNGFSFSMTGPDGSGKTTLLIDLETSLSEVYREVKLNHFRPSVIPRIAELGKKIKLKKEVDENYSQPHRGGKTSKLSSWVRLFYYIIDYIVGYKISVKPVLFRRGVVIFDRYFTDVTSDSKRSKIYLNFKTIFSLRHIVPEMNYNFIIFVKPELILQRKQELTRNQIDVIYEKLNYICETDDSFTPINNDEKPQVAINNILDFILKNQDEKYDSYFR